MFNELFVILLVILVFRAVKDDLSRLRGTGIGPSDSEKALLSESNSSPWQNYHGWPGIPDGGFCINPATGLPMMSGSPHGYDTGGNLYGFSEPPQEVIPPVESSLWESGLRSFSDDRPSWECKYGETNPATGLPMVLDMPAGFAVGGNPYGSSNHGPSQP